MAKRPDAECPTCGRLSSWSHTGLGYRAARCYRSDCRTPEEQRLHDRHVEIKAGLRSPVAVTLATCCIGCGDTHNVKNDPDTRTDLRTIAENPWAALIPCPICPTPCPSCTSKAGYCARAPCSCACHTTGKSKARKVAAKKERRPKPAPTLETNAKRFASLPTRIDILCHVVGLSRTLAWRWDPIDMVIRSVLVRQDGSATIELGCPSLSMRAAINGQHSGPWDMDVECDATATMSYGACPSALREALDLATQHMKLLLEGVAPEGSTLAKRIADDSSRLGITDGDLLDPTPSDDDGHARC